MATHSSVLALETSWTEEPVATVSGVANSQTRLSDGTRTRDPTTYCAWFQSFQVCWSFFCDPGCGLSWSVLPGCLKRVFILLLFDGQLCKRPLGPVAWWRFCLLLNLRWLCVDVPSFADSGVWRSLSESYNFRFGYFFFQLYYILLHTHTHTHTHTRICIYVFFWPHHVANVS